MIKSTLTQMSSKKKKVPTSTVGANIIAIRTTLGMSNVQLAEKAGIFRQALWRIESERVEASLMNLKRIRKALGVSWDTLLRGVE